jgi:hypothetical protein
MKMTKDLACERLQDDFSTVYDWALVEKMQFNGTKFEVMRYGVGTGPECHMATWHRMAQKLKRSNLFKISESW